MKVTALFLVFTFLLVVAAPSTFAKHVAPLNINPVVHQGVRYVVPNDKGLRAYVEAWDIQTGRKLWTKTVFSHWYVPIPFGRTECMYYEYITSMTLQTNMLVLTSERGRQYALDTQTRAIRKIRTNRPNKTAARERRECAAVPVGHPWRGVGEPYRSARVS